MPPHKLPLARGGGAPTAGIASARVYVLPRPHVVDVKLVGLLFNGHRQQTLWRNNVEESLHSGREIRMKVVVGDWREGS